MINIKNKYKIIVRELLNEINYSQYYLNGKVVDLKIQSGGQIDLFGDSNLTFEDKVKQGLDDNGKLGVKIDNGVYKVYLSCSYKLKFNNGPNISLSFSPENFVKVENIDGYVKKHKTKDFLGVFDVIKKHLEKYIKSL